MELRKDYILERWSYISGQRAKRPHQYEGRANSALTAHPENCPFCPGREELTPPEIGRIIDNQGNWLIRWLPNKYPALELGDRQHTKKEEAFYLAYAPYGIQEVIVDTPSSNQQMADLAPEHLSIVFKVYQERIKTLSQAPGIQYVLIFKNEGKEAGASIIHSHSQVMAVGRTPTAIEEELRVFHAYQQCPYCDILKKESESPRKILENEDFIAFCPYAPRFNYETWIFPKRHFKGLGELQDSGYLNLAKIFKAILEKLKELGAPYCFYLQYGPQDQDFHFHFEILPQLNIKAGFELSGGDSIVSVSPEDAAAFYRGED